MSIPISHVHRCSNEHNELIKYRYIYTNGYVINTLTTVPFLQIVLVPSKRLSRLFPRVSKK